MNYTDTYFAYFQINDQRNYPMNKVSDTQTSSYAKKGRSTDTSTVKTRRLVTSYKRITLCHILYL